MGKGRAKGAKGALGLGFGYCIRSFKVPLGAERVQGAVRECVLEGASGQSLGEVRIWVGLWGVVKSVRKLVSGPRGSGVKALSAYWVGAVGQRVGRSGDLGRGFGLLW